MTEPIYLSPDELRELTDRARTADQVEWLVEHGWRFAIGRSGRPKVAREYWRKRMVSSSIRVAEPAAPDFSGVRAVGA